MNIFLYLVIVGVCDFGELVLCNMSGVIVKYFFECIVLFYDYDESI